MRNLMLLSGVGLGLALSMSAPAAFAQRGHEDRGELVRCESRDNRRRDCQVDTRGGVELVRQLSGAACDRGRTWDADARGIWVDRGCRAEFAVGVGRGGGNREAVGETFRCESTKGRERLCEFEGAGRVELVRQLSDTRCVEGRNWGQSRNRVWVDGGCRGEFQAARGPGDRGRWRGGRGN